MLILHHENPPAIVRSIDHPSLRRGASFSLEKTMFGTMVYPTPAETEGNYENEGVTAKREYSTNTPYGKYKINYNPDQSCQQILSNEEDAGEIPAGESCSCPPGAKTPQCYNDDSQVCQELLQYDQSDTKLQYDDCSCSEGSGQPTCTPYYQLCEDNLPSYEADYPDDECSCSNPTKSATPNCISYYQLCEENLPTAQADNPDDECWCDDPQTNATPHCESDYDICESAEEQDIEENPYQECSCPAGSTTPSCESYYDICESNASQYENSNTSCTCSQTSVDPTCCSTNTTQHCTTKTTYSQEPGVEEDGESPGVTTYCQGKSASICSVQDGGLQVCYQGICRNFSEGGGLIGGVYQDNNWACGACGGNDSSGCSPGQEFTIWYYSDCGGGGPTVTLTGGNLWIPHTTTTCTTQKHKSCTVE